MGIIPARGGSKRVPFKNLTIFKHPNGRMNSLLGWAIEHAESSRYIDYTVVSSDAYTITESDQIGLLKRPDFLAEDRVSTEAVVTHVLYTVGVDAYDYLVVLQPTSPLRTRDDIDDCIKIAVRKRDPSGHTGCVSYGPDGKRNGAVYVAEVKHFLQYLSFDAANHYEMPMERSLDIDYVWQFPDIAGTGVFSQQQDGVLRRIMETK